MYVKDENGKKVVSIYFINLILIINMHNAYNVRLKLKLKSSLTNQSFTYIISCRINCFKLDKKDVITHILLNSI